MSKRSVKKTSYEACLLLVAVHNPSRLNPAAIEFALRLKAACLSDTDWLSHRVFEAATEVFDPLRPGRAIDPKPIEYRRGICWRRASFASDCTTSHLVQKRQVICLGHRQEAFVATTLIVSTPSRAYRIILLIDRDNLILIHSVERTDLRLFNIE